MVCRLRELRNIDKLVVLISILKLLKIVMIVVKAIMTSDDEHTTASVNNNLITLMIKRKGETHDRSDTANLGQDSTVPSHSYCLLSYEYYLVASDQGPPWLMGCCFGQVWRPFPSGWKVGCQRI